MKVEAETKDPDHVTEVLAINIEDSHDGDDTPAELVERRVRTSSNPWPIRLNKKSQKRFSINKRASWQAAQEELDIPQEIERNRPGFQLTEEQAEEYFIDRDGESISRSLVYHFGVVNMSKS